MRIEEGDKIKLIEPRTPKRRKGETGIVKKIEYLGDGRLTPNKEYDYECFVVFDNGGSGYYYIADLEKII